MRAFMDALAIQRKLSFLRNFIGFKAKIYYRFNIEFIYIQSIFILHPTPLVDICKTEKDMRKTI